MKKCKVAWLPNQKLQCVTHQQALFYVYRTRQGIVFVCQVGEDENARATRRKRILGKEEAKRFDRMSGTAAKEKHIE